MVLIKPGAHWDNVHFSCHETLVDGFLKLGIFKVEYTPEEILESGISYAFFPHGVLSLVMHNMMY
jgi:Xaa-Pro dipeptidase